MSKSDKVGYLGFLSYLQEYEGTLLERLEVYFFYSVLLRIRVGVGVS